jgi:very-short-patch-repair endonuclease
MRRSATDKAQEFLYYWRACVNGTSPDPVAEYPFTGAIGRRHRFDFAFVSEKVAVEIEGNAWHVPGGGKHMQDADLEKYNLAASMGWRVLRFSPAMLKQDPQKCIDAVLKTLAFDGNATAKER